MNTHLMIIDPQNDFCDIDGAALPVPGANEDMKRLASFVDRLSADIDEIHVTLDSHRPVDIAHPIWWVDSAGQSPSPYTTISADDIKNGVWSTRIPDFQKRSLAYAEQLEGNGNYQICIWPPHCLIGTWGHNVHADLNRSLQSWSENVFATVNYITKGTNPWTEHYGGLQAEVPDPSDPETALNKAFIATLSRADRIIIAGEASSHCVKETVTQIVENISKDQIAKLHILIDCCSPVPAVPGGPDFPRIVEQWLDDMKKRGMTLIASSEFTA